MVCSGLLVKTKRLHLINMVLEHHARNAELCFKSSHEYNLIGYHLCARGKTSFFDSRGQNNVIATGFGLDFS